MGKKLMNTVLFLAVMAGAVVLTFFAGKGSRNVLVYNFGFLGVMALIYIVGLIAGLFRMNDLGESLKQGADEIADIFKLPGKARADELIQLRSIFKNRYLDRKMDDFVDSIGKSQEGIGEVEEYINLDEVDVHIHKRLLELAPDIFTSLGILGTFVGLVWGLKNFEPTDYEAMTSSVAALVDGIKVAFLTSIYGIGLSIVYTFGMKSEYSSLSENMQLFLERFHALVLPTAENESRNILVASQKTQTQAMEKMAEQFSVQMADSFEKVITPTFQKMNDSLDVLTASVTRCQQDAIREILDTFVSEMHDSFKLQFTDFNEALEAMKKAQKDNTEYTTELYKTMSQQLSDNFVKQEHAMKDAITEIGNIQEKYMNTANKIIMDNQNIQKLQQQDYKNVTDYLREAEQTSAKFWVACNQTMQKYVETAAEGMQRAASANQLSSELIRENKRLIQSFDLKLREFTVSQKTAVNTMDEVRRLLSEIKAAGNMKEIQLSAGAEEDEQNEIRELLGKLEELLEGQGTRQEALLEEMDRSLRELSKVAQKGRFSLFK